MPSERLREDLTRRAVRYQIQAMGRSEFEIGVLTTDRGMLRRRFEPQPLYEAIAWLKAENSQGGQVYISPVRGAHDLSLVDDLTKASVTRMKAEGYQPAVVVETSSGNFQAWLKHPQQLTPAVGTMAARTLAEEFGGDRAAADFGHLGRLAGFTNRKEKHFNAERGYYPFVKLIEATGVKYERGPEFVGRIVGEYRSQQAQHAAYIAAMTARFAGPQHGPLRSIDDFRANPKYGGDGHVIDRAYAVYALAHGVSDAEVAGAIASRDLTKKGGPRQQQAYIEHTIEGARRYLGTAPRQEMAVGISR